MVQKTSEHPSDIKGLAVDITNETQPSPKWTELRRKISIFAGAIVIVTGFLIPSAYRAGVTWIEHAFSVIIPPALYYGVLSTLLITSVTAAFRLLK